MDRRRAVPDCQRRPGGNRCPLTDLDLDALRRRHQESSAWLTLGLKRVADPSAYGVVALDDEGRVARFQEKPGLGQAFSRLANTGIYCVEPRVLERIPRGRACDWSREVFPRMLAEGRPLFGQVLDGYWCDVGSIDEYRRGQWDALKGTVRVGLPAVAVSAGVWFGADAWVAPGAVIQGPVLLGAGCRIERDAWVLPGSVIGDRTVVRAGACVGGAVVGQGCRIGRGAVVRDCVLDDGVWVGAAGSVSEGAVVGRGCRLGAGARVGDGQRVEPAQRLAAAAAPITAAFQTPEVPQPARPGARSHRGGTAPVLAP